FNSSRAKRPCRRCRSRLWVKNLEHPHCKEQIFGVNEQAVQPWWFVPISRGTVQANVRRGEILGASGTGYHAILREAEGLTDPLLEGVAEVQSATDRAARRDPESGRVWRYRQNRSRRANPPVVREAARVRNSHRTGPIERGSVARQRSRGAVWPTDLGPSLPSCPRDLGRVPSARSSNVSLIVHPARPGERLVRDRPGSARGCSYGRSRRVSWG